MALVTGLLAAPAGAQSPLPIKKLDPVRELGVVQFARDLDAVLQRKPVKPIFLQFQEIPG